MHNYILKYNDINRTFNTVDDIVLASERLAEKGIASQIFDELGSEYRIAYWCFTQELKRIS